MIVAMKRPREMTKRMQTAETKKPFCPLIQGDCRRDCQWCDTVTEFDDEGVLETLVCAVMGIYAYCLSPMIDEDGWAVDDD